jgi:hypothetical protein
VPGSGQEDDMVLFHEASTRDGNVELAAGDQPSVARLHDAPDGHAAAPALLGPFLSRLVRVPNPARAARPDDQA